jgi:hypothetical protein
MLDYVDSEALEKLVFFTGVRVEEARKLDFAGDTEGLAGAVWSCVEAAKV